MDNSHLSCILSYVYVLQTLKQAYYLLRYTHYSKQQNKSQYVFVYFIQFILSCACYILYNMHNILFMNIKKIPCFGCQKLEQQLPIAKPSRSPLKSMVTSIFLRIKTPFKSLIIIHITTLLILNITTSVITKNICF